MQEDLPTFPVTGWEIHLLSAINSLILNIDYLPHASAKREDAIADKNLLISIALAEELASALSRAVQKARSGDSQIPHNLKN